jgi:O-antigen/teichoic acid export membrane protein
VCSPAEGHKDVRKAGFIVLLGTGLGAGVSLVATPFISRLFSPAVYGSFALLTGVVSVFTGVSTLRLEVQSLKVADDAEAAALVRLGLIVNCAWGVALTLAAAAAAAWWHAGDIWLSIGPLVFLASLQLLGSAVLTRARRYRDLAVANFVQGASMGLVQLLFGLASAGVGALLAGFGAARLGWIPTLRPRRRTVPPTAGLWRRHRTFAAMAGSSAFINSLTGSLPVVLLSVFYGDATVGQFAMATRILLTPLSLVSQSAASANIGEVGRLLRRGDDGAVHVVRRGLRDLLAVGLIPCAAAAATGAWVVPLVLGPRWREAGLLLAVLAAGTLAQFVTSPFSQLLNLTGHNRMLLTWDTSRLAATVLSLCLPRALGLSPAWAIGSWSIALVVIYCVLAQMVVHVVAHRTH